MGIKDVEVKKMETIDKLKKVSSADKYIVLGLRLTVTEDAYLKEITNRTLVTRGKLARLALQLGLDLITKNPSLLLSSKG